MQQPPHRRAARRGVALAGLAAGTLAMALSGLAMAQFAPDDDARGVNVRNRPRPETDPQGVRAGSFIVHPTLRLDSSFDDNILANGTRRESDFFQRTTGTLDVRSDWGRHGLRGIAVVDDRRYLENPDENYLDWRAQGTGRYDITRSSHADLTVGAARVHQERDDPDDFGNVSPIGIDERFIRAGYFVRGNRLGFRLDATFNTLRHDDAEVVSNGVVTTQSQAFRNRDLYELTAVAAYEVAPLRRVLVVARANKRDYVDETGAPGTFTRDSKGGQLLAGVDADYNGIFSYRLLAGYLYQEYEATNLPNASAPTGEALLLWNVTTLTTVGFRAERRVQETIRTNASSYLRTIGTLSVDHEYARNILLNASATYRLDEFEGTSREDKTGIFAVGASYLLNRNVRLGAIYTFTTADRGGGQPDYERNVFLLRLQGAL